LVVAVTLPRNLKGKLEWHGKQFQLTGGPQRFAL
jgi:hypothetical protein